MARFPGLWVIAKRQRLPVSSTQWRAPRRRAQCRCDECARVPRRFPLTVAGPRGIRTHFPSPSGSVKLLRASVACGSMTVSEKFVRPTAVARRDHSDVR